ncbi:g6f-like [Nerophis lumbriciformis]|uniref:g6f-like n=1 Tax=Nerophis lumbriciformis TaxID=546530 RepID=UPI002ADF0FB7|nr:g6f-like [Nerophis lumbriciformis]
MECFFLTFVLVASTLCHSAGVGAKDWDEVMVGRPNHGSLLRCIDREARGVVDINWVVKPLGADDWKLALSANKREKFSGVAYHPSMRLADPYFYDTGDFSLFFQPTMHDVGLYKCFIKQQGRIVKKKTILVAFMSVTTTPRSPVPQQSTLSLIAKLTPEFAVDRVTWISPDGRSLKTERKPDSGIVAKLPQVSYSDVGRYTCRCVVHPDSVFDFTVLVTVDALSVASFTNVVHGPPISTATQAEMPFHLTCPGVQGDYILLYWQAPNSTLSKLVYQYDRWRDTTLTTAQSQELQLAGSPGNAESGIFSFILTPGLEDGGVYICDVLLNDHAFSQRTLLSVLKVTTSRSASKLVLDCLYSELSEVQSAMWEHHNKSHGLEMMSSGLGSVKTYIPLPVTPDTAGNYTCTLQLSNGQTVSATHVVKQQESVGVPAPSQLSSLSALLLLAPLFAAAVAVLLWRQKHISNRAIEQSLSMHSGEAENIYENPEDVRQVAPPGSVYMDLKPRKDDVYKELERNEQCQS